MKPRDIFLAKLKRGETPRPAVGSATSIVTTDLMDKVGASFPEAHLDAENMAALAEAGYTELGFDNVMPLFSVWHESAALGCAVDWGAKNRMPAGLRSLCGNINESITIPRDLLQQPPCAVPLAALRLLKRRHGDEIAVVGKIFGPWTLGYHVFGVENFLMATMDDTDAVKRAMRTLIEVSVQFGRAQIDAGADALTVGDHCTRDLCSPDAYREFLVEIHHELKARLPCPLILHICGDTSDRIPYIKTTGIDCFHFDSKVPAATARKLAGNTLSLMGGTSNLDIVRKGTAEAIARDVSEKLASKIDVIGPECAVPLDAPYRNLKLIAEEAKKRR
jgi:[methyl-Co(III) methanol-specific corrinoid protein]:coenzyme M methyltransferase